MCKCGKNKRTAKDLFIDVTWTSEESKTFIGFKTRKNYGSVEKGTVIKIYRFDYDPKEMSINE